VKLAVMVVPAVLVVDTGPPFKLRVADESVGLGWKTRKPVPAAVGCTVMAPELEVVRVATPRPTAGSTVRTGDTIVTGVAAVPPMPLSTVRSVPLMKVIPVVPSVA